MKKVYKNERIKNLEEIASRYKFREIEGCTSWRHYAVHEDRGWLLRALDKIRNQVEAIRQAAGNADANQVAAAEIQELLAMFEEARLNHLGDEDK